MWRTSSRICSWRRRRRQSHGLLVRPAAGAVRAGGPDTQPLLESYGPRFPPPVGVDRADAGEAVADWENTRAVGWTDLGELEESEELLDMQLAVPPILLSLVYLSIQYFVTLGVCSIVYGPRCGTGPEASDREGGAGRGDGGGGAARVRVAAK